MGLRSLITGATGRLSRWSTNGPLRKVTALILEAIDDRRNLATAKGGFTVRVLAGATATLGDHRLRHVLIELGPTEREPALAILSEAGFALAETGRNHDGTANQILAQPA